MGDDLVSRSSKMSTRLNYGKRFGEFDRVRSTISLFAFALVLTALGAGRVAAALGYYTQQQAAAGQQIFTQHCTKCHGSKLQGQSGPPLAGAKFKSNLEFSKISAQQLFTFIKTQMPYDAPASLSKKQYLQALAYILSKNGYPQGATPLSERTLGQVKLLPYPSARRGQQNRLANAQYHSQQLGGGKSKH